MDLLNTSNFPKHFKVTSWENNSSLEFNNIDLFILNCLKYSIEDVRITLEAAAACLKDEGFIIILVKTRLVPAETILSAVSEIAIPYVNESDLESIFSGVNLNIISKKIDPFASGLYLLRKRATTKFKDSVIHVIPGKYTKWVNEVKEKMIQLEQSEEGCRERIWLISEGSPESGIIGFVNCLRLEPGGKYIRCIFIRNSTPEMPKFRFEDSFYKEQLEKNLIMNVYQNGSWGCYRFIRCYKDHSASEMEHAYLDISTIGDLSSLSWIQSPQTNITPTDNKVLCHIYYASLNFKDAMVASGRVSLDAFMNILINKYSVLGTEFSGRTLDGRRVMGIVPGNAIATTVLVNPYHLLDVPDDMSLEEAATIPVVYLTAYFALVIRGRLQKGERILIHSGSGGVGQAAITIAFSMGCDVYTTVGSQEKKEFLKQKFPQLRDNHISSSRDTSFEQDILIATKGKGVDVVLNSLAEEKLIATLNCLAVNGRFLEIGKYDIYNNSSLGMAVFSKSISFHGIMMDTLIFDDLLQDKEMQQIRNALAEDIFKPLKSTVFNYEDAEKAFRYMARGNHIGKVLLKIRDEEKAKKVIPSPIHILAKPRITFGPQKSFIIIGGLGGMGLELCDWLVDRGAKYIILTSRSGVTTGYQKLCLQRWKQDSVNIEITKLNAANSEEASDILELAAKLAPVGGIFNLALVLKDNLMKDQTIQNFLDVCDSKIEITKNMDLLTREFCSELDHFVCFSSFACGRGSPGQSNYGYANSAMERICEERVKDGLPGLVIQWGAVGDVGFVDRTFGSNAVIGGAIPQRISSCMDVLEQFLLQRHPVGSSIVPHQPDKSVKKFDESKVLSHVANIFGIKDISSINPETTLGDLGMDSVIAVELRQILEVKFDTIIPIPTLRNLKIKDLQKLSGNDCTKDSGQRMETEAEITDVYIRKISDLKSEELVPTDTVVGMNTIADGVPLFLIHPIDGSAVAFKSLAKSLTCPVYGIQFTTESPNDSLENLASWYLKCLTSCNISIQCMNLVGYSYGAAVALEMAIQADRDPTSYPQIKNLVLLDGSPGFVTLYSRSLISHNDGFLENFDTQIEFICGFLKMHGQTINLDKSQLMKLNSYQEQMQYTADKIAAFYPNLNSAHIETIFNHFKSMVKIALNYSPRCKLARDVHLIKVSEKLPICKKLSDTYDLEKECTGKIIVHEVEGNHQSVLEGDALENLVKIICDITNLHE